MATVIAGSMMGAFVAVGGIGSSASGQIALAQSTTTCKPGNGFGDKNHCHFGPPGQTTTTTGTTTTGTGTTTTGTGTTTTGTGTTTTGTGTTTTGTTTTGTGTGTMTTGTGTMTTGTGTTTTGTGTMTTETTTTESTTSTTSTLCKPGHGYGDKNHCHSGPPGHSKHRKH